MTCKILQTPIDELIEIVKVNNNCTITFLRDRLRIPTEVIERWITILEEYEILKVHYRGFEGYIQIVETKEEKNVSIDVNDLKNQFLMKAKLKSISTDRIAKLWLVFINEYMEQIKDLFFQKAKVRGYEYNQIVKAWELYKKDLEVL